MPEDRRRDREGKAGITSGRDEMGKAIQHFERDFSVGRAQSITMAQYILAA